MEKKVIKYYRSFYEVSKVLDVEQFYEFNSAVFAVLFYEKDIDSVEFDNQLLQALWASIKHSMQASIDGFCSKKSIDYKSLFYNKIDTLAKGVGKGVSKGLGNKDKDNGKDNGNVKDKDKDNKHFADSNESAISYKKIYKHYLSKPNLIKHRKFTPEIRNAMKLAEKRLKLSENDFIKIIDRHSEIVEESKHETKYQVRARPIAELFGQKVYQGTALICSEYLDDGSKWLRHSTGSSETGFDTGGLKFAN